jgi:hypothetical protein
MRIPRYGGVVFNDSGPFLEQVSVFSTVGTSYPQFSATYPQIRVCLYSILLPFAHLYLPLRYY